MVGPLLVDSRKLDANFLPQHRRSCTGNDSHTLPDIAPDTARYRLHYIAALSLDARDGQCYATLACGIDDSHSECLTCKKCRAYAAFYPRLYSPIIFYEYISTFIRFCCLIINIQSRLDSSASFLLITGLDLTLLCFLFKSCYNQIWAARVFIQVFCLYSFDQLSQLFDRHHDPLAESIFTSYTAVSRSSHNTSSRPQHLDTMGEGETGAGVAAPVSSSAPAETGASSTAGVGGFPGLNNGNGNAPGNGQLLTLSHDQGAANSNSNSAGAAAIIATANSNDVGDMAAPYGVAVANHSHDHAHDSSQDRPPDMAYSQGRIGATSPLPPQMQEFRPAVRQHSIELDEYFVSL